MQWLKHAFAIDPPGPAEPTAAQAAAVDRVAGEIVRRHLATPSLMALEMGRPLNFLGAQAMHFFAPFVSVFTDAEGYRHFAEFLEQRGSIAAICNRIEELAREDDDDDDDDDDEGEAGAGEEPVASEGQEAAANASGGARD